MKLSFLWQEGNPSKPLRYVLNNFRSYMLMLMQMPVDRLPSYTICTWMIMSSVSGALKKRR